MDVREAILSGMKEIILPELNIIKEKQIRLEERINSVDQRLADINAHLVDQSRRIDETNKRIDSVRDEFVGIISETNRRIDETNNRIDSVRSELVGRLDSTNERLDRLYEVIVRRDEHRELENRVTYCERKLAELESKLAA
ncbi:MAG: hypothetical protein DRG59_10570 [Deltaproteobacteria bacterium]|nr:MAG: hypothetical protein DRG83_18680 [Deltaproteobacteria bacterium]RLB04242.1 MAG: hypothetical protein DRG59_10570 [Deltaproteobacteria bacterium]